MNAPLILLHWLRLGAWFRRMGRKLGTAKGLLLTAIGLTICIPQFIGVFFSHPPGSGEAAIEGARRFGPMVLLAYCVLSLVFSPGEKAFVFSPAEMNFLFPAPFGRRRLLLYKIGGNAGLTFLVALLPTAGMRNLSGSLASAYLGLVLTLNFFLLFAIAVTLAGAWIGEAASSWRRRLGLMMVVVIACGLVASRGWGAFRDLDVEALKTLDRTRFVQVVLAPFRPFALTLTARSPGELITWGGASLAINLGLLAMILLLDPNYLEMVEASSRRFYEKAERIRRGGLMAANPHRPGRRYRGVVSLPWWGGAGPVLWRQATTVWRAAGPLLVPAISIFGTTAMGILLGRAEGVRDAQGWRISLGFSGTILFFSLVFVPMLNFDFRGDWERIEGLKTLPIRPNFLVLGQMAGPILLITAPQVLAMLAIAVATWPVTPWFWAIPAACPLLNAFLVEVENLMFLWFPSRPLNHSPNDVQAVGRAVLMLLAKFLTLAVAVFLAVLCGAPFYFLGGWPASAVVAWLVLLGLAALMIPIIAAAFRAFDVTADAPD